MKKDIKDPVLGYNITAKAKGFIGLLSNPGNDLGFIYKGCRFRNAEHCYQTWKSGSFDRSAYSSSAFIPRGKMRVDPGLSDDLMIEILVCKLLAYPFLIKGIYALGGRTFLRRCRHQVKSRPDHWQSNGDDGFIKALRSAYAFLNPPRDRGYSSWSREDMNKYIYKR